MIATWTCVVMLASLVSRRATYGKGMVFNDVDVIIRLVAIISVIIHLPDWYNLCTCANTDQQYVMKRRETSRSR